MQESGALAPSCESGAARLLLSRGKRERPWRGRNRTGRPVSGEMRGTLAACRTRQNHSPDDVVGMDPRRSLVLFPFLNGHRVSTCQAEEINDLATLLRVSPRQGAGPRLDTGKACAATTEL